mmetsp:Transcript_60679/g.140097  ORF Transcript_60679/g.140097 Transcript_60679/m.140097 type:complete len:219 (-) Transcript_60679:1136-1792(-)
MYPTPGVVMATAVTVCPAMVTFATAPSPLPPASGIWVPYSPVPAASVGFRPPSTSRTLGSWLSSTGALISASVNVICKSCVAPVIKDLSTVRTSSTTYPDPTPTTTTEFSPPVAELVIVTVAPPLPQPPTQVVGRVENTLLTIASVNVAVTLACRLAPATSGCPTKFRAARVITRSLLAGAPAAVGNFAAGTLSLFPGRYPLPGVVTVTPFTTPLLCT